MKKSDTAPKITGAIEKPEFHPVRSIIKDIEKEKHASDDNHKNEDNKMKCTFDKKSSDNLVSETNKLNLEENEKVTLIHKILPFSALPFEYHL